MAAVAPACCGSVPGLLEAEALLAAAVRAGASKQVVASTATALWRALLGRPQCGDGVGEELAGRMQAIEKPIAAQVRCMVSTGFAPRSAAMLVRPCDRIMANAAKHVFTEPFLRTSRCRAPGAPNVGAGAGRVPFSALL